MLWVMVGLWVAMGAPEDSAKRTVTLEAALRTAQATHPAVRQAQALWEQQVATTAVQRANLLPQLNGNAAYSRSTNNFAQSPGALPRDVGQRGDAVQSTSVNYYSLGLTLTQLIYDFGQTFEQYNAAKLQAESQQQSARDALASALMDVRSAFFAARQAQAAMLVQQENLANQEKHRAQIEAYVRVGKRPNIDLLQARTDYSNARVQLLAADANYRISLAKLNRTMGVESDIDYVVADEHLPPIDGEDAPMETLLREALDSRADYRAMALAIASQRRTTAAAGGAYWPSLNASAGITDAGQQANNLAWNWHVGLNLNWSLFGSGETWYNVRAQEHAVAALVAQHDGLRQDIRLAVEQAQQNVQSARAELDAAEDARLNAQELLKQAEGRYNAGIGSIIELGDAQLKFTQAATQKVQNEYALASARVTLHRSLGRL